jgi:hypothetical protein
VSHLRSVAQRPSCHPQKHIFKIRLNYPHALRYRAGVEKRRQHGGKTIRAMVGHHVKMVVLHGYLHNPFNLAASGDRGDTRLFVGRHLQFIT